MRVLILTVITACITMAATVDIGYDEVETGRFVVLD